MTTIVGVCKGDLVVIAGDSQTTFGDTKLTARFDADAHKFFFAAGAWLGIAGSAAHDLVLRQAFLNDKTLDLSSRKSVFDTFCSLHAGLKERYFLNPVEEENAPYESNHMAVLIAHPGGLFGVFSMREVFEFKRFWAIGSGEEYARGAMEAVYNMDKNAEEIATIGVRVACEFDTLSSLPCVSHALKRKPKPESIDREKL